MRPRLPSRKAEDFVRVYVDQDLCQGHTLCNMAAPDVFHLRAEDGHSYVAVTEFTADIIASAKRAATTCPEQAIIIEG
jgi:ferredoxin